MYNVVILVGGETTGTRFRPLSINQPKTLFPICGKPLITHIIDSLLQHLTNIDQVFLLGYFKDESVFVNYTKSMNEKYDCVNFSYLSESISKGTAGGLYQFKEDILSSEGLIFVHGDIICDYPFDQLYQFHQKTDSDATILGINPLLIPEHLKKYLKIQADDVDRLDKYNIYSNFGTLMSLKGSSQVEHYVEKPSSDFLVNSGKNHQVLINGGIYIFKSKSILKLLNDAKSRSFVESPLMSLELDILRNLPQLGMKFLVFKSNDFWYNLKTPLSALLANGFFLGLKNLTYKSPIEYRGSQLGPNVYIGNNVSIGKGVRIKNAIIGDDVVIGDNTLIINAIISKGSVVGSWCRIEGSITNSTLYKDIVHTHSDGNIKCIHNLVVLCDNTSVLQDKFVFNSIVLPHKELKYDTKYEIVM